jgi:hypothetical protein
MFDKAHLYTASSPTPPAPADTGDENAFVSEGEIILEMNINDYSMAQIAHIIEDNDAKIWSSSVFTTNGSSGIEVRLTLNRSDLTSIIQSFLRYGYSIKASAQGSNRNDDILRNHYDQLMMFLNV